MARQTQRITSAELRRIFNEDEFWERAQSGEFEERVLKSRHPAPRASGEPYCTRSQMVGYHLPDGSRIVLFTSTSGPMERWVPAGGLTPRRW